MQHSQGKMAACKKWGKGLSNSPPPPPARRPTHNTLSKEPEVLFPPLVDAVSFVGWNGNGGIYCDFASFAGWRWHLLALQRVGLSAGVWYDAPGPFWCNDVSVRSTFRRLQMMKMAPTPCTGNGTQCCRNIQCYSVPPVCLCWGQGPLLLLCSCCTYFQK